jgi:hypothetical protein
MVETRSRALLGATEGERQSCDQRPSIRDGTRSVCNAGHINRIGQSVDSVLYGFCTGYSIMTAMLCPQFARSLFECLTFTPRVDKVRLSDPDKGDKSLEKRNDNVSCCQTKVLNLSGLTIAGRLERC